VTVASARIVAAVSAAASSPEQPHSVRWWAVCVRPLLITVVCKCVIWKPLCLYILDARLELWVSLEHTSTCVSTTNQAERHSRAAHLLARWEHERTIAERHVHKQAAHLLSLQPAFYPECNGLSQFRKDQANPLCLSENSKCHKSTPWRGRWRWWQHCLPRVPFSSVLCLSRVDGRPRGTRWKADSKRAPVSPTTHRWWPRWPWRC